MSRRQTPTTFSIIIVGAGTIGLATALALSQRGHKVLVLERRSQNDTTNRGSGIALYPNSLHLLRAWNVDAFFARSSLSGGNQIRRYDAEELLKAMRQSKGGHQSRFVFRADLIDALYEAGIRDGVRVEFGARVASIDTVGPMVTLADGRSLRCDVLVGADGIRSLTRRAVFPESETLVRLTGDVAFQITVPKEVMYAHPTTKAIYDDGMTRVTMGQGKVLFSNAVHSRDIYDAQLVCRRYEGADVAAAWGEAFEDPALLLSLVKDWDEGTRIMFGAVQGGWKWRIGEVNRLSRWSTTDGRIILVGDACHAMLPAAGHGTGQGLEDAAVLAEILSHVSTKQDLGLLSKLYYELRRKRVEKVQDLAHLNADGFTMKDGPEQEKRDAYLKMGLRKRREVDPEYVDPFGEAELHVWLDGFDVVKEAHDAAQKLDLGVFTQSKL